MKKLYVSSVLVIIAMSLSYCHTAKKAVVAKVTYDGNIKPIIMASCAPCHIPSQGGNKEAYDVYDNAKKDIDGILHRIQLAPTEKGFMPMRHPKLDDNTIAVIKKWQSDGLLQK